MTEQTVPEPTAFGAAVMDIALERGGGNQANLELPEHLHEALEDHVNGIRNYEHDDLALLVAYAFGLDPNHPATEGDRLDLKRLAVAWTFSHELIVGKM